MEIERLPLIRLSSGIKLLMIVIILMNLSGCYEITDKRLVTYHVTFEADGTKYNVETSFYLYHTLNISYETFYADYNKADIDGRLKDGSKYEIHVTNIPNYLKSNANVHSQMFVQISPTMVESFDQNHFKSPHHVIDIQKLLLRLEILRDHIIKSLKMCIGLILHL